MSKGTSERERASKRAPNGRTGELKGVKEGASQGDAFGHLATVNRRKRADVLGRCEGGRLGKIIIESLILNTKLVSKSQANPFGSRQPLLRGYSYAAD